jgi:Tfp pilus assembly protein PilF
MSTPTLDQRKKAAASAIACGDMATALAVFHSLIPEMTDNGRLWFNIAICHRRQGDDGNAQTPLKRAILCAPSHAASIHEWAHLSTQGGRHSHIGHAQAIYCNPWAASVWSGRGSHQLNKGDSAAAKTDFQRAALLQPSAGQHWFNLSLTVEHQRLAFLKSAITTANAPADAYDHLGAILQADGQAMAAIQLYRTAIKQQPDRPDIRANLAAALIEQDEATAALAQLDEVLCLDPESARARWMRAWINLSVADFDRGYADFDVHWQQPDETSRQHLLEFPLWTGQPLDGPLLIWGETGVGDEILFASLVKEAAQRAKAPVILECEPRLVALFARSLDGVTVIARTTPPDPRLQKHQPAAQCSSIRLPLFLRRRATDFPHHNGYLTPPAQHYSEVRKQFDDLPAGPLIGISWWSSNPRTGSRKSIPLADLKPLFEALPDAQFVSLQYNDDGADIAQLRAAGITNLWPNPAPHLTADLDGLAAQINAVDAVVTIVGVNAHMAGALGRPGFVIMQKAPLWYWFRSGSRSPWYPSLHIAREDKATGFTAVIKTIRTALQAQLAGG